jgi:hypothetical protein
MSPIDPERNSDHIPFESAMRFKTDCITPLPRANALGAYLQIKGTSDLLLLPISNHAHGLIGDCWGPPSHGGLP